MLRRRGMLNIEKYKDELIKMGVINGDELVIVEGKPAICRATDCSGCEHEGCDYVPKATEWLFSEYKEPEVDWSKVKVDTPILVKDILKLEWIKRYFAKYENGRVYVWKEGKTSWSAVNGHDVNSWKYAKLAEREDEE